MVSDTNSFSFFPSYHPELLELKEKLDMLLSASKSLAEGMREKIAQTIDQFGTKFSEPCAFNRSQLILDKSWPLSSPLSIISLIQSAACDIEASLSSASKLGQKYAPEEIIEEIVVRYSELMGKLIYIRSSKEKKDKDPWDAKDSTRRFRDIGRRLQDILQDKLFQADHARDLHEERLTVDKQYKAARERLENELPTLARLHMSTIGSSHRLPGDKNDVDSKSIMHRFGRLSLEDDESEDGKEPLKKTVVIFDESGCIPSYELLGLTRLGRPIESLVLVGDKHQLPPYDATQGRNFRRVQKRKQQISLLDSSALTGDTGKIMLTTQYRVPQDIADMLNARIYGGNYKTCPRADVPLSGLRMINVPKDRNPRKKYVNSNEVNEGLRLINNLTMESEISSILVITPVSLLLC